MDPAVFGDHGYDAQSGKGEFGFMGGVSGRGWGVFGSGCGQGGKPLLDTWQFQVEGDL